MSDESGVSIRSVLKYFVIVLVNGVGFGAGAAVGSGIINAIF